MAKNKGLVKKLILMFLANALGLYLAARFLPDVDVALDPKNFSIIAGALTLINLFLRPIVKLLFLPVIILTLGLASFLVNAAMLYLLDFLMPTVTIGGLVALFLATLILSLSNIITRILGKIL